MNGNRQHQAWWENVFSRVWYGHPASPRELQTREVLFFQGQVDYPYQAFDIRRLDLDYIRREFQWYIGADKADARIANHAKLWKDCQNADGTWNSNYGYYLFWKDGFTDAMKMLEKDMFSRRAYVSIFDSHIHKGRGVKDIPCTMSIGWSIRKNPINNHLRLHQLVTMRSNDLVFGLGNDAPVFAWLHQMAHRWLSEQYTSLQMGVYIHQAHSLHVYERHFDMVQEIAHARAKWVPVIGIPDICDKFEVEALLNGDTTQGKFSKWLYGVEL